MHALCHYYSNSKKEIIIPTERQRAIGTLLSKSLLTHMSLVINFTRLSHFSHVHIEKLGRALGKASQNLSDKFS